MNIALYPAVDGKCASCGAKLLCLFCYHDSQKEDDYYMVNIEDEYTDNSDDEEDYEFVDKDDK